LFREKITIVYSRCRLNNTFSKIENQPWAFHLSQYLK